MRKIFIIALLSASVQLNAQLYVSNAAEIKLTSGALLTINDFDLVNNGTFNQSTGTVRFTGNTNTNISGTQTPVFNILEMAKGTNNRVLLQRTVNVGNQINFVSGYLDLNGNNILLQPSAFLNNEDETSRITGTTGGYVEITNTLNAPTNTNPGNLGATITSTANMGSTIIRRGHKSQTNGNNTGNSVYRYFDIIPTNNTALNATLNFKYFDAELNGLTESLLTLWKSTNNTLWIDQGFNRRSAVTNYVEKSNVADFSRWTLSMPGNPLPIQFSFFGITCNADKVVLNWRTAFEQNSKYFEVQRSNNSIAWTAIGILPAAGFSNNERAYSFSDNNPLPDNSFYRIAEFDIDGRSTFTAIKQSGCSSPDKIQLWPNPVQDKLNISLNIKSANIINLNIYDSKGSLILQQQKLLQQGSNLLTVDMNSLPKGTYYLRMVGNNDDLQQQFSIIKQ